VERTVNRVDLRVLLSLSCSETSDFERAQLQRQTDRFTVAGLSWVLDPDARDSEIGLMLQAGNDPREARHEVVKSNPHRRVMRIELNGSAFYLKQHVCASRSDRLRALLLPSRAQTEWDALSKMRRLGFETVPRIACAHGNEANGRTSLIVTEAIEGALNLTDAVEGLELTRRTDLLKGLGAQIRILHDRGVYHRDMQPGNFFVETVGQGFKFCFLDLHRVKFSGSVPEYRRLRDIGQLVFNLQTFCSPAEVNALLRGYSGIEPEPRFVELVKLRAAKLADVRKRSRAKRCLRNSTQFLIERKGRFRIYHRRDTSVESLLNAVNSADSSGRVLGATGTELHIKQFKLPGLWQNFKDVFQKPRGRRAWHAAHALMVRGILTPRPLGLVEEIRGLFLRRCWLVTEYVKSAPTLSEYVHDRFVMRKPNATTIGCFLRELAGAMAAIYREDIYHSDLKASNILVKEGHDEVPEFYFTDLDGIQLWRKPHPSRVIKNLVQLFCSLPLCVARPAAVRFFVRFLRETGLNKEIRHMLPEIALKAQARLDKWIKIVRKYGKIL
jgi:tRNA A-37 threonylcarbamoyl transferase component Bud32